jgi:hypothetical protein
MTNPLRSRRFFVPPFAFLARLIGGWGHKGRSEEENDSTLQIQPELSQNQNLASNILPNLK